MLLRRRVISTGSGGAICLQHVYAMCVVVIAHVNSPKVAQIPDSPKKIERGHDIRVFFTPVSSSDTLLNWRWFSHSTVCRIKILAVNVSIKPQIHLHFVRIIGFVPLFYNPCHITLTLHIHEPTSYWEKAATPVNAVRAAFQHLPRRTTALRHL